MVSYAQDKTGMTFGYPTFTGVEKLSISTHIKKKIKKK